MVALGAAIQAHALLHPQKGKEVLLLDVTPQNLGIMVVGGYFATIIPRNTTVPTSQSHLFTTVQDNQTSVRIAVLQGEPATRPSRTSCSASSCWTGSGRPGAARWRSRSPSTSAPTASSGSRPATSDTGQQQSITVTATSGLTEDEMRRILDENLDEMLTRRQLGDFERLRDRTQAVIAEIEALVPAVKEALERSRFGKDAVQKAEEVVGAGPHGHRRAGPAADDRGRGGSSTGPCSSSRGWPAGRSPGEKGS